MIIQYRVLFEEDVVSRVCLISYLLCLNRVIIECKVHFEKDVVLRAV
jgi:hypothetical protein